MNFGDTLSYWMEKKGMNAYELSELSGVPVQTIYSMVKRNSKRADVEYIIKIAKALEVTVDELLSNESTSEETPEEAIETIAAHAIKDLTDEEIEEVINFAKFIKTRNRNNRD